MAATLGRIALVCALLVLAVHAQGQGGNGVGGKGESDKEPPRNKGQETSGISNKPQRPPPGPKPTVDRQGGPSMKKFVLSSGGFNIEANGNGNVPFYRYWADGQEASKTKIMFMRMFQTTNPSDPASSTKLAKVNLVGGYNWAFTDVTQRNDSSTTSELAFNMTGTPKAGGGGPNAPKPNITFVNRLVTNANGTELKFDVSISNFLDIWWASGATALVTAYRVVNEKAAGVYSNISLADVRLQRNATRPSRPCPEGSKCTAGGVAVEFGNGNGFEAAPTATGGGGGDVNVIVSVGIDNGDGEDNDAPDGGEGGQGSFLFISYAKFSGSIYHDPSTYNQATSSASLSVLASQTIFDNSGKPVYVDGKTVTPDTGASGAPLNSAAPALTAGAALRGGAALALAVAALLL